MSSCVASCQHVLPGGLVRIRHFGSLASAHRTALLALCSRSAQLPASEPAPSIASPQLATWRCPLLRSQHAHRAQPHLATTGLPMQPSRLLLIPTPPPSLSNVRRHIFAGLRLSSKITAQSPTATHIQTARLVLSQVPISLSNPSQMSEPCSSMCSLRPVSPSAP